MLNQFVLVGRIKKILFYENIMVVSVIRTTKDDGIYISDNLEIKIPTKIMDNIEGICHVETMIGIKGVLRENPVGDTELVAEKITVLSNTKHDAKGGEE